MRAFWLVFLFTASVLADPIKIITTFSILGNLVSSVGRDKVVISIVGPNSDAHLYEPKPQDVKEIANSSLVFVNGLGFEGWMDRLIESSGYKGKIVTTTAGIPPRMLSEEGHAQEDPHAWHDVTYAQLYIQNILKALVEIDPANKEFYEKNAKEYLKELQDLHAWIVDEFKALTPAQKKIITAHDAFGYFGARYGVEFLAPQGISTTAEPTVQAMVTLIQEIKKLGIQTIFVENIANPTVIKQLAEETGAKVGEVVYSDALSNADEPGHSYLALMRHNVIAFKKAMNEISIK